jgi:hypothetical protein
VLLELTSLKHKVEAMSDAPAEASGNVEQLTKLHNKLVQERQAKKIYPDCDFKKECNQNNYNTCRDIACLLTHVDSSLLPFNQQEALAKALKWVEGRAASVIMGSLKGWGTASHIASDEQTFLELHWKDAITEAQHKCKAKDKGKGQSFFQSSQHRMSASVQHKPAYPKLPTPSSSAPSQHGKDLSSIVCFKCNKPGHYTNKCPVLRPMSSAQ